MREMGTFHQLRTGSQVPSNLGAIPIIRFKSDCYYPHPVIARRELFRERKSFFAPDTNAAIHREHVLVAHFLQVVGGKRRAVPPTTV
jgi:hypothetical protein